MKDLGVQGSQFSISHEFCSVVLKKKCWKFNISQSFFDTEMKNCVLLVFCTDCNKAEELLLILLHYCGGQMWKLNKAQLYSLLLKLARRFQEYQVCRLKCWKIFTRIRLPAKLPWHMCIVWLVFCSFLLSWKCLRNIFLL